MFKHPVIKLFTLYTLAIGVSQPVFAQIQNYQDYRALQVNSEIAHLQNFHLRNAQDKISKQQFAYAWGDLAYLLCQVPNHHVALQHMLDLAPKLSKQEELKKYLETATKLFPEDAVLRALYNNFLVQVASKT